MNRKIAVITGPTATGKTALGVALAQKWGGEVVSADSMQVYRGMDIGTAKPTRAEMAGVVHHMIDVASPFEAYSVARYAAEATKCVDDILSRGLLPIVVGGTGLYIDALVTGRTFARRGDPEVRRALLERYDAQGGQALHRELLAVDPAAAARLHPNDKKRIVRALEIVETTGRTITEHDARTRAIPPRYDARVIALSYADRADLYGVINRRVDEMLQRGLLDEVSALLRMGLTAGHTAMQAIGYKELAAAIHENGDLDQAADAVKTESRRYAKRQLSWLRADKNVRWILWDRQPNFDRGLQISTGYLGNNG